MSDTKKKLESLAEALDDAPIDEEEARAEVARLGVDVKGLAARLRATVAKAGEATAREAQQDKVEEARRAYAAEVERLERRKLETKATREEQLVTFRALLARAPRESVAVHFHKYESATDEELSEMIRALRHLLGEDED